MGDIYQYEEELSGYPVRNRLQRSFVQYFWAASGGDDLVIRGLWFFHCVDGQRRLPSMERKCTRFLRFNKKLIRKEFRKVKSMKHKKAYFKHLFKIKHYMLLFIVGF